MNLDKMNNADPAAVAKSGFTVIDRLQTLPAHIQVMGAAAVFLILSEVLDVSAQDIFTTTKNLMNSKEGLRPEFGALRDYTKHELKS